MDSEEEMIVAILHPYSRIIEKWSFDKFSIGFSIKIINSLRSITKENENEDYEKFIDTTLREMEGKLERYNSKQNFIENRY